MSDQEALALRNALLILGGTISMIRWMWWLSDQIRSSRYTRLHKAPWHWHGRAPTVCHWDDDSWCRRMHTARALGPLW